MKRLRNSERHLREQNENVLDAMAKRDLYFTRHQEAEQDARKEANRAQSTIGPLKHQASIHQEQMRALAKQFEQIQHDAIPAGAHCETNFRPSATRRQRCVPSSTSLMSKTWTCPSITTSLMPSSSRRGRSTAHSSTASNRRHRNPEPAQGHSKHEGPISRWSREARSLGLRE
jgi:hypothetical protein